MFAPKLNNHIIYGQRGLTIEHQLPDLAGDYTKPESPILSDFFVEIYD